MINANKLRVGNIVSAPVLPKSQDKCYHVITNIGDNYAGMINLPDGFSQLMTFEDIEAIPLTEEILLKCDDLNNPCNKKCYHFKLGGLEYLWAKGQGVKIFRGDFPISTIPCDYLHQLQNLYFALTGEELEIK